MNIEKFLNCGTILSISKDKCVVGYGKRIFTDHPIKQQQFYAPDYFLKDKQPWFYHEYHSEINSDDLHQLLQSQKLNISLSFQCPLSQKNFFENSFHDLQKRFSSSSLTKAVPYIFEYSDQKPSKILLQNVLVSILDALQDYPLYIYGFWDQDSGMLGATPEILFSKDNNILNSMACAGTKNNTQILNSSEECKLAEEHRIVIDDILHQLSPFGNVQLKQTQLKQLPQLSHLITPIAVSLKANVQFLDLIHALHPTPALGAYPRQNGWNWLQNYQSVINRGRYGAPFGYVDAQQAICLVAIRNMQWDPHGTRIGAGCGVTKDSVLENEWNEIQLKLKSIKKLLQVE